LARKIRLGLIFGGRSAEHEVSLMSARSVLKAIDNDKYEVTLIGITREGKWVAGGDPLTALAAGDLGKMADAAL
jgi:D-alanine-D-alanine ligase